MIDIEVSLGNESYFSPLIGTSVPVNFTLKNGGNLNGNIAVYTINTPTSISFSSDFEKSESSPDLDLTKLVKVWIIYDEIASKAIYSYEFLTSI